MGDALFEAAMWAFNHFEAMDRANAQIHCAPVRYSPITFRLAMALAAVWSSEDDFSEEMANVLNAVGTYEPDPGR